jgi:hypothetical protein
MAHQHTKITETFPILKELKHLMYTESRHKEFKQEAQKYPYKKTPSTE